MRNRQMSARTRRRIEVRYTEARHKEAGHPLRIGFSGNLSDQGMMIRTPRVHPPGTLLRIELRFPQQSLTLTGRVVWAREGPVQWVASGKIGMGVRFVDPPPELAELVRGAGAAPAAGRGDRET